MFHLLLSMVLCCLLQDGLLFLLPHLPRRIILGVAWRGPTPVLVVSTQVGVIIKEVLSMVIMIIRLTIMQAGFIARAGPLVHCWCSMLTH
jgi:hypothetical protein